MLPSPSSTEQQEDEPLLREPHVGSTVTASFVFSNLSTADVEHSVQHDLTDLNWIYVLHSLEFLCSYGDPRSFLTASVTELHSLAASGSGKFRIVLQSCMSLLTHTQTTSDNRTRILLRSCFHADGSWMILSRTCVDERRDR